MNYDIDTPQGMENAKAWTANMLDRLKDNGTWVVPRSGTVVSIDKKAMTANLLCFKPDPSISRVLRELGYTTTERVL